MIPVNGTGAVFVIALSAPMQHGVPIMKNAAESSRGVASEMLIETVPLYRLFIIMAPGRIKDYIEESIS